MEDEDSYHSLGDNTLENDQTALQDSFGQPVVRRRYIFDFKLLSAEIKRYCDTEFFKELELEKLLKKCKKLTQQERLGLAVEMDPTIGTIAFPEKSIHLYPYELVMGEIQISDHGNKSRSTTKNGRIQTLCRM